MALRRGPAPRAPSQKGFTMDTTIHPYSSRLSKGSGNAARLARGGAIALCVVVGPLGLTSAAKSSPKTEAYVAEFAQAAQLSQRVTGVPASIVLAQGALESDWGRKAVNNNHFGIKCHNGDKGPYAFGCAVQRTHECTPNCHTTRSPFRMYTSAADSFNDHGTFLRTNPRYANAFKHTANPDQFAKELQAAGYATDKLYAAKLIATMRSNNLYRLDVPSTPVGPAPQVGTATAALAEARKWLGYRENPNGSSLFAKHYGFPGPGVAWCDFFVKYVGEKSGNAHTVGGSRVGRVADHQKWFQDRGRFLPRIATPRPGDIMFFSFPTGRHVEIVESVRGRMVTTIGGNTWSGKAGDQRDGVGVFRRSRPIDKTVTGFGRPAYRSTQPPNTKPTPTLPLVSLQRVVDAANLDPHQPDNPPSAPSDVRTLEQALARKDYLADTYVDGRYGWQTVRAYSRFQQDNGIPRGRAKGIPGIATLTKLGKGHFNIIR